MLTVGTDCSGIEAPLQALTQMKIPYKQLWSCDIDKYTKITREANYPKPEMFYDDMLTRDNTKLPSVDLYVCGFPCQSFSSMGKRLGTLDPRAKVIPAMIDSIKNSRPKVCILENVKRFINVENGVPKDNLVESLKDAGYNVYYDIYNTKDYGIPQNRERVYFVCIRKDIQIQEYIKPNPCKMKSFESILENHRICKEEIPNMYKSNLHKIKKDTKILKWGTYYSPMSDICPTLDNSCHYFYIIKQNRTLSIKELFRLQGFSDNFKITVSEAQMCKQIGNAMSVNVLKKILKSVFKATNL